MRILLVDTDKKLLKKTKEDIAGLLPDAEILCHESSLTALAAARKKMIDIAFLEADMPELDGLLLGQYLRDLNPQINLIYFTDSPEHGYDALKLHASGYILKVFLPRLLETLNSLLTASLSPSNIPAPRRLSPYSSTTAAPRPPTARSSPPSGKMTAIPRRRAPTSATSARICRIP